MKINTIKTNLSTISFKTNQKTDPYVKKQAQINASFEKNMGAKTIKKAGFLEKLRKFFEPKFESTSVSLWA